MTAGLSLYVAGVPVPQGSKRAFPHYRTGRVVMVDDNSNLAGWRDAVTAAASVEWGGAPALAVPVWASLSFYLPRPAGHFGTGRNAGTLRPSAPTWPGVKPDLDKLVRAVFDSLTAAGVWTDDARCVGVSAWKFYADGRAPGVALTVEEVEGAE